MLAGVTRRPFDHSLLLGVSLWFSFWRDPPDADLRIGQPAKSLPPKHSVK